ncbi:Ferredoxin reductase-type FAD-binding domain protein [Niveomyces insectorum RCEF 264]|uniref:Ferredoxin reductase-type FAD-binding domain protein n=1 Tax=Niveomyces insectorum RCEF 264 TaxID=1081102 RepID=A0A167TDE6_9HYPO|nr:Ferredoxin reductase-type FAD-binding domain protein [Niveomyces insectorum RCEF 264]
MALLGNRPGWHPGEVAMHKLLNGPQYAGRNPTTPGFAGGYAARVAENALLGVGALDRWGRPWATVWGGEAPFADAVAPNVLGVRTQADVSFDPVLDALLFQRDDNEGGHSGDGSGGSNSNSNSRRDGNDDSDGRLRRFDAGTGPLWAGMSIDLDTQDRVKLAGRLLGGTVLGDHDRRTSSHGDGDDSNKTEDEGRTGEVQLVLIVDETLGNCPKYVNRKAVRPHTPHPRLLYTRLSRRCHKPPSTSSATMDANHRGGPVGFLRVERNGPSDGDDDNDHDGKTAITLVYPEYSGNRLYQTLGNLYLQPRIGLAVPDVATGDVLYATGRTEVLVGAAAAAVLPHIAATTATAVPVAVAVLAGRQILTPTVARFTWRVQLPAAAAVTAAAPWTAGQYAMLDFGAALDKGWSHMRDDDPQSLNDDFVRTFTVSSPPPLAGAVVTMEMTLRRHGPATGLLWRHDLRGPPLAIPVLAFGGDASFRLPAGGQATPPPPPEADRNTETSVFVAGGVGITPLLAQAAAVLASANADADADAGTDEAQPRLLWVLWSLRAEDLPLAVDSFGRIPGLARCTTVFVTSSGGGSSSSSSTTARKGTQNQQKRRTLIDEVQQMGATVVDGRRIQKQDLEVPGGTPGGGTVGTAAAATKRKVYVCAPPALLQNLQAWLVGEQVVWESFAF